MYFWRIKRLKEELRAGPVRPADVVGYIIAFLILFRLPQLLFALLPTPAPSATKVPWWPQLPVFALAVGGLWLAYRANGGPAGRDLAGRLLALHWVLGLRFMVGYVVMTLVGLPFMLGFGWLALNPSAENGPLIIMACMLVGMSLFFWRLVHHLRDLNAVTDTPS